MVIGR